MWCVSNDNLKRMPLSSSSFGLTFPMDGLLKDPTLALPSIIRMSTSVWVAFESTACISLSESSQKAVLTSSVAAPMGACAEMKCQNSPLNKGKRLQPTESEQLSGKRRQNFLTNSRADRNKSLLCSWPQRAQHFLLPWIAISAGL